MDTRAEAEIMAAIEALMPALADGEPVIWDCGSRAIAVAMNEAMQARLKADGIRVRHDSGIVDRGGEHYLQALNLGKLQIKALTGRGPMVQ